MWKEQSLQQTALGLLDVQMQKINLESCISLYKNLSSIWTIDLNLKNYKHLENIEVNLYNCELGNDFLNTTPKA